VGFEPTIAMLERAKTVRLGKMNPNFLYNALNDKTIKIFVWFQSPYSNIQLNRPLMGFAGYVTVCVKLYCVSCHCLSISIVLETDPYTIRLVWNFFYLDVSLYWENLKEILYIFIYSPQVKIKVKLSQHRPWRPLGLLDVEDPTLSRRSAHKLR
jgi:hypothetical protein